MTSDTTHPPIYVFEDSQVDRLYPLTYARAACELSVGRRTLLQRLRKNLGLPIAGALVRSPLAEPMRRRLAVDAPTAGDEKPFAINPALSTHAGVILLNARWLFLSEPSKRWTTPGPDTAGLSQGTVVWLHLSAETARAIDWAKLHEPRALEPILAKVQRSAANVTLIDHPWDLLAHQRAALAEDFAALGRALEADVMPGAHLLAPENMHLGGSAGSIKIWPGAVLDAREGPIIVEVGTEIRANSVITGPVAIGPNCVIRTGADIREETVLGKNCKVGGEVIGSIFLGNANKQHHGFVGQSIIGEWANLGAGTTTSNLKNTYGPVKMPINGIDEPTGRQFLGSVIGDHAKLGIGTYLSTGSVVGFGSHVIAPRPPRFVPSFAWLTASGMARANFEKIEQVAAAVMKRRGVEFSPADHELFVRIATEWCLAENFAWPAT